MRIAPDRLSVSRRADAANGGGYYTQPAIMMTAVAMMLRKRLAILTTVCVFVPQPAIGSGSSPVAKSR